MKVYALHSSVAAPLDNAYEAKAETVDSLKKWHENHRANSIYTFSTFLAFPVVSWVFLLVAFLYINKYQPEPRVRKLISILKGGDHRRSWECKLELQNQFTLSLIFVLFSVALTLSAVSFANLSQKNIHSKIDEYYSNKAGESFWYVYAIVYVLLAQDSFILIAMGIGLFFAIAFSYYPDLAEISRVEQLAKNLTALADTLKGALRATSHEEVIHEAEGLAIAAANLESGLKRFVKPVRQSTGEIMEKVIPFQEDAELLLNKLKDNLHNLMLGLENLTSATLRNAGIQDHRSNALNDLLQKVNQQQVSIDRIVQTLSTEIQNLNSAASSTFVKSNFIQT